MLTSSAGRRAPLAVEWKHAPQGHHGDGDAESPDGGAATRGRVAAAARRGCRPSRRSWRSSSRLLAERLADIPDEVNRIPASVRRRPLFRAGTAIDDSGASRTWTRWPAIGKSYRERIIHDIRVPVDEDESGQRQKEGWLSDAAGRSARARAQSGTCSGAGPNPGVGVHGRRTAPIDPLGGENAREALSDNMGGLHRIACKPRAPEAADANVLADAASAAATAAEHDGSGAGPGATRVCPR